ncbi:MAG: flippase-like domain-containing protein [Peptostreptococcaceae bacterium]|nr:flippase-like domain-containing protein [Peptostreptococcaceae bacterium]
MKTVNIKIKYLLLLVLFFTISYISLLGAYHFASDKSSFLSLGIFSKKLFIEVAFLLVVYYMTDALRFYFTLKAINVNVSIKYIINLAFINIFVSNITPSATGGGVAQIYFLSKKDVPIGAAIAGSSIRTALPLIFFAIFTPIILIFDKNVDRLFPGRNILFFVGIMVMLDIAIILIILKLFKNPDVVINILKRIKLYFEKRKKSNRVHALLDKLIGEIKRFPNHIKMYITGNKIHVFLSVFFTLLYLFTLFLFPVLLIKDLNPSAPAVEIILSQIVITFVMYFAPTPGASGVAEATFILLFSNYVSQGDIVSLTFTWRLFTIYIGVVIGMILFYIQVINNRDKIHVNKLGRADF